MNFAGTIVEAFSFPSASLFLIILPLILLLGWDLSNRGKSAVTLTGLEYLRSKQCITGRRRKFLRTVLWSIVVIFLGVLWAEPVLHSSRPVLQSGSQSLTKNIIVAIDISASMGGPLELPDKSERFAAYGKGGKIEEGGQPQTRYEAARRTLFDFLERFQGARIGLILFSTEPFLARWPTVETNFRFLEVVEENIGPGESSQLQRFSSLTNTDKALELAQEIFARQNAVKGGAVIHISDAEDDLENMGSAIRNLREKGIRLYIIGVGISETIVSNLSQEFVDDPGFRIFRVDSEEEMKEAYRLVSELEESPQYTSDEREFITDLRWVLALVLVVIASIVLGILETVFHKSLITDQS